MPSYPSKPWADGQTFTVIPGQTFQYSSSNQAWEYVTNLTHDSDHTVDVNRLTARLDSDEIVIQQLRTDLAAEIAATNSEITSLNSSVSLLTSMSDSETARIQSNIADIQTAYARLDSDSTIIQGLRTDLEAEISATNSDVTSLNSSVSTINSRLDSDETVIQDLQTQITALSSSGDISSRLDSDETKIQSLSTSIDNLSIPVISATQPTGQTGQLWVNITNGRMYYWNDSDAFVEIVTGA